MCIAPWVHAFTDFQGNVRPCCVSDWAMPPLGNIKSEPIESILNNKNIQQLRADLLAGRPRPDICRACHEKRDSGFRSLRDDMNDDYLYRTDSSLLKADYPDMKLRYLDLRISNVCNFKCRTCSEELSSSWAGDSRKMGLKKPDIMTPAERQRMLQYVHSQLPHVEKVFFVGGEPLLMKEQYDILAELIRLGRTHVPIMYNSNGSVLGLGKQDILPLWKKFKTVLYFISMDHFEERAELIRHGVNWNQFLKNVQTIKKEVPHVDMTLNITVSNMNVLDLPQIIERLWQEEVIDPARPDRFNMQMVYNPPHYHVACLPEELRKKAGARIKAFQERTLRERGTDLKQMNVVRKCLLQDKTEHLPMFVDITERVDAVRGENFYALFPELKAAREYVMQ